ncbi:ATP-dependent zinc metalloprotease FtsH [Sulfidibacter corallicola]|uniref:ATP-dependent zinc metalloprotease FtsH n=1 Tax=Sulfidibacter corallicola TaxID=2818388 RepID=A0A8A4TQ15_SULCO|nr:ATP-dependent zinc metalloprotease FtsH [Sulfidibacter corallicola]QTD48655.1 ATP-dependent zinc metalloprotease FtsH [Sulfidibacter corallicola]
MNNTLRTLTLWLVIPLTVIMIVVQLRKSGGSVEEVNFSDVVKYGQNGLIQSLTISPTKIEGEFKKAEIINDHEVKRFSASIIFYDDLVTQSLGWAEESVKTENSSTGDLVLNIFTWVVPFAFFLILWFFFIRQMQAGGNKAMMFGKSKAKLLTGSQKKITFVDVAGCDEAKEELQEIIEFLKEPQKFQRLGGKIPKGVLLMGPPGTGKTLLARATAGEANVPFFSISGSDFVEMFVGVGASRVRDLFDQGKKNAPCIIFIDEIDAVGRHRGAGMGGGHDEREQTLNQLLVEMDGFESNDGVILVAATNRPDVLDPALLRPGRFDRRVVVDLPDVKGREAILKVHTGRVPLSNDVDLPMVARGAPGFSGADLANMVNEAALLAARKGKKMVFRTDFEDAKDKIMMGAERRSMILSEDEKRNTAIHESGHAVVAAMIGEADPVHKVTIIPRGRALGVTQQLPLDDRHSYNATYLENRLAILMGGRIAEELFLNQTTSGARNDIEVATNIAKQMVCELGMSKAVGPISLRDSGDQPFLGRDYNRPHSTSEKTAQLIDAEVKRLIEDADRRARKILSDHRDIVQSMADKLLEIETISDWQVQQILQGQPVTLQNPKLDPQSSPNPRDKEEGKPTTGLGVLPDPPPLAQT